MSRSGCCVLKMSRITRRSRGSGPGCQEAFAGLFVQVLLVAGKAGLARFGTVAIDGTKIAANASVQANRDREWLAAQVAKMLAEADQADAAEDARHGHDGRGGGMSPGLADPTRGPPDRGGSSRGAGPDRGASSRQF